uniref:Holliday junction recognition protein n=2 Tax=Vombatus ursinus TaxID=29139 RepID=A0A4X2LVC1_VOMUR
MAGTVGRQREGQRRRLLEKLQASNRRFASVMGTLVAKYDRPFEEDKLVHIATLTYETPSGLRVWGGGRIITQEIFQNIQMSLEKEGYSLDNVMQSTFTDVRSNGVDESLVQRNDDISLKDDSLRNLPESDLDKKYMTRVDVILEDDHPRMVRFDSFRRKKAQTAPNVLSAEGSPNTLLGCSGNGPWENYGIPVKPTSSWLGPPDTRMPLNQSLLAWRARRGPLRDTTFGGEEATQNLTLGDIYTEMLCSLCKCLPSQKMGLVSTSKYISKGWFPKKRRLDITLTMESSFLKISQKFRIIPGEKSSFICRNNYKPNFSPCIEPDTIINDSELLTTNSFPLALKAALHNRSTWESPSRPRDVRQAAPSPSQSHTGSQSPVTPSLCLPPALTSAKERFRPLQQGPPGRDVLGQERYLSRSQVMPRMLQTPKNSPLSHERLPQERSASDASETGPKTGVPRKVTKARKSLPFCMEQTPCKARDVIDSMFDTYSQETTQWAQELLFLKKSGQKSKVLTQSKFGDSVESLGLWDGPQEPQKAASPRGIARDSLCGTVTMLHCTASPRAIAKGDYSSPTKRRKVSSSQTWDLFSPSKMRDKA